jgi:hypothetical protein
MSYRQWLSWSAILRTAVLCMAVLVTGAWPVATSAQVLISSSSTNPDGGNPNDPLAVTACNGAPQLGVVYRNSETEPHTA